MGGTTDTLRISALLAQADTLRKPSFNGCIVLAALLERSTNARWATLTALSIYEKPLPEPDN
jgi:hypothetical protein